MRLFCFRAVRSCILVGHLAHYPGQSSSNVHVHGSYLYETAFWINGNSNLCRPLPDGRTGSVTKEESDSGTAYDPVLFEPTNNVKNDQEAEIERMSAP